MPTIIIVNGVKFFFYSNDHEPVHVHVSKAGATAKVAIRPEVKLLENKGFSPSAIKNILKFCGDTQEEIIEFWEEFFS